MIIEEPFQQWGIDFIGPISPQSSVGHSHILTTTNYFTNWVEAILVKHTTSKVVCDFIKENILGRFGVPQKLVTDSATSFSSNDISLLCYEHRITLSHSIDYYPQGNEQAKSRNKILSLS